MNAPASRQPLGGLKRQLTIGYAITLGLILTLLGTGLYLLIHAQLAEQLDQSLRAAAKEIQRAARTREVESANAKGAVDAVDELRIPDRMLFLLDTNGTPETPSNAILQIRQAAKKAAIRGSFRSVAEIAEEQTLSIYAERFQLASGRTLVAVAAADQIELADRYAALIAAFTAAAIGAVVLSTIGGYFFVQQAISPAERSMAYTKRFVADAAHELRTPVSVLRAKAEVALQSERTPEHYRQVLRDVDREANRLGRIVNDLLILARADAGARQVIKQKLFLDDVVGDATSSIAALAQAGNVTLTVEEFEETPIIGDAGLIRELAIVLLDNAVKFTPSGGRVVVRVKVNPPRLVVEDTGVGISKAQAPHVFQRFYRGDASRPRDGGAGLGLSIAQWIASVHNAQVSLDPRPDGGTIATATFEPVLGRVD